MPIGLICRLFILFIPGDKRLFATCISVCKSAVCDATKNKYRQTNDKLIQIVDQETF